MSRPLRIGWIGCGRHAQDMLLPHLVQLDVRLGAVSDIDAAALRRTAERYGVSGAYSDAADLFAHPGLEGVGLAIGSEAHEKLAVMALERDLAVVMEKPPAASAAGAERIAAAAERAGRSVVLGFMQRFAVGNRIARNVIAGDEFGQPLGFLGW